MLRRWLADPFVVTWLPPSLTVLLLLLLLLLQLRSCGGNRYGITDVLRAVIYLPAIVVCVAAAALMLAIWNAAAYAAAKYRKG